MNGRLRIESFRRQINATAYRETIYCSIFQLVFHTKFYLCILKDVQMSPHGLQHGDIQADLSSSDENLNRFSFLETFVIVLGKLYYICSKTNK